MIKKASFKIILSIFVGIFLFLILAKLTNTTTIPEPHKTEIILATNLEQLENLQSKADNLLNLFDKMSSVPIYLKEEPILKSGSNTERGVAYTNCPTNKNPAIIIKKQFYEHANQKQLTNIIKHELTHSWLCRQNLMFGHDEMFRKKFSEVGGFGN